MNVDQETLETTNVELNHQVLDALLATVRRLHDELTMNRMLTGYVAKELGMSEDRIEELYERARNKTVKRRLSERLEDGEL